jgi:hypothetical protein
MTLLDLLLLKEAVLCSKCAVTNCFFDSPVIMAVFWTVSTFLDSYKHKILWTESVSVIRFRGLYWFGSLRGGLYWFGSLRWFVLIWVPQRWFVLTDLGPSEVVLITGFLYKVLECLYPPEICHNLSAYRLMIENSLILGVATEWDPVIMETSGFCKVLPEETQDDEQYSKQSHFFYFVQWPTNAHNYFTNYHTATCFDTVVSSSDSL